MGSAFRLPIWLGATFAEVIAWCVEPRCDRTVAAAAAAQGSLSEIDWRRPRALILGTESTGLSPDEIASS